MATEKHSKVITSRKWDAPNIETFISVSEIGSQMELTTFLNTLAEEIGDLPKNTSKAQLKKALETASIAVLHEMRSATVHIL
jgi:hypothetical protein